MNKLGIFMNFWEKNWDVDHVKYIKKAKAIGFDVLEFQAQPLLEMSDDKIRSLKALADEVGIELTYSLGLDRNYDVSSLDEKVRKGGEVSRDIHVYRNLVDNPTEAGIDAEAAYLLNFEKEMLKKYNM